MVPRSKADARAGIFRSADRRYALPAVDPLCLELLRITDSDLRRREADRVPAPAGVAAESLGVQNAVRRRRRAGDSLPGFHRRRGTRSTKSPVPARADRVATRLLRRHALLESARIRMVFRAPAAGVLWGCGARDCGL